MRGCFGKPNIPGNDGLEYLVFKIFGDLSHYFLRQSCSCIEHSEEDAADFQVGVYAFLDKANGLNDEREPFEREIFTLQRDNHFCGCGEPIQRQYAEGRRTVDENEFIVFKNGGNSSLEIIIPVRPIHKLDCCTAEIHRRRSKKQPWNGKRLYDILDFSQS